MIITKSYYEIVCDNCGKIIAVVDDYPNKESIVQMGAVKTKRHVYCTENCKTAKIIQSNNYKHSLT